MRILNASWDATPRRQSSPGPSSGSARNQRWDAPTPRRGGSPGSDNGDGAIGLDAREGEEEQIRLDRDWYMGAEEGGVVGDEEYNPLAHWQYDNLAALKEEQMAKKQVTPSALRLLPSPPSLSLCGARVCCRSLHWHMTLVYSMLHALC